MARSGTKPAAQAVDADESVDADARKFVRYADYLQHVIETAPKRKKGDRTRDMLKLGAIRVLDDVGYHAMRVSDICAAAGVAVATFYIYFENKEAITRVVLAEYLDAGIVMMAVRPAQRTPFATILASHMKWLEVIQANAGLARCILQLGDEVEEFRDIAHAANRRWYERVARSLVREQAATSIPFNIALFTSYALGSMMDELARKLVIHPDPALVELTAEIAPTPEALAELLAVLWHQALYGPVPASEHLSDSAARLAALVRG